MEMEPQRLIAVSLGKIALSKGQRGGLRLHKSLLVAGVLLNARSAASCGGFSAPVGSPYGETVVELETNVDETCTLGIERVAMSDSEGGEEEGEEGRTDEGIYDCEAIRQTSLITLDCRVQSGDKLETDANSVELRDGAISEYSPDRRIRRVDVFTTPVSSEESHSGGSSSSWRTLSSSPSACQVSWNGGVGNTSWNEIPRVSMERSETTPRCSGKRRSDSSSERCDYSDESLPCKRFRYDSESSYCGESNPSALLPCNESSANPEMMQTGENVQMSSLVHSFSAGFSGLLRCAEPGDYALISGNGRYYNEGGELSEDILSCSTQIREALETLSRPILAMSV